MHHLPLLRVLRRLLPIALLTLNPAAVRADQTSAQHLSTGPALTAAQAQSDFDLLRKALEEAHGGLYRFSSKAELERRFDDYRARLRDGTTQMAFVGLLSEMLAAIRDGHARLEYDADTAAALTKARLFPLRLLMEGSRLVVWSNDTPDDANILPGMEIIRINGRSGDELLALLLPKLAGDGFIETGKKSRLGRNFGRNYWLFIERAETFTVVARDSGGRVVTVTLAGVLDSARDTTSNPVNTRMQASMALLDGSTDNVALRFISDPEIAYLRIRGFESDDYRASIATVFGKVHGSGAKALILDLRANGGGVDQYGALLVSQFTDKPFRYFDRIHLTTIRPSFAAWKPSTFDELSTGTTIDPAGGYLVTPKFHSGIKRQSPAPHPFLGKLFVLMDGGTFSTAADVCAVLHHLRRATFIGTESGGAYEGNTSGTNALIVLPNSKLGTKIQMYGYWNAVAPGAKGRGTMPEYPVEKRVADVLAGVDAPLERAVALARAAVAAQSKP